MTHFEELKSNVFSFRLKWDFKNLTHSLHHLYILAPHLMNDEICEILTASFPTTRRYQFVFVLGQKMSHACHSRPLHFLICLAQNSLRRRQLFRCWLYLAEDGGFQLWRHRSQCCLCGLCVEYLNAVYADYVLNTNGTNTAIKKSFPLTKSKVESKIQVGIFDFWLHFWPCQK